VLAEILITRCNLYVTKIYLIQPWTKIHLAFSC